MTQDENEKDYILEELSLKQIDTRLANLMPIATKFKNRIPIEVSRMKFIEIKKYEESIEVGFLEKAGYYAQITYRIIKTLYPIIIPLFIVFGWIDKIKQTKRG